MLRFILIIIYLFSFSFSQNKNKTKEVVFSNYESIEEYLDLFNTSFDRLKIHYVDSVNESEMIKEGIKGMMKKLDPYTKILEGDKKESYDILRKGKYGGVGIQIGLRRDTLTVLSTFENSPAYSEGISVGDNIMMIDSTSTEGLTLKEASGLIKGEIDSIVVLHIYRSSSKQKIKFELARSNIPIKNVPYWGVDDNGIGYIRITKFSKNSDKDFKQALKELSDEGMKS